ncbi:MAG: hypothetical protein HQL67_06910 [Magnetococcales bacterium]|nr:hypothetical protein [Magnetococcales bacterium]
MLEKSAFMGSISHFNVEKYGKLVYPLTFHVTCIVIVINVPHCSQGCTIFHKYEKERFSRSVSNSKELSSDDGDIKSLRSLVEEQLTIITGQLSVLTENMMIVKDDLSLLKQQQRRTTEDIEELNIGYRAHQRSARYGRSRSRASYDITQLSGEGFAPVRSSGGQFLEPRESWVPVSPLDQD